MAKNTVTVLRTEQTFELPENISIHEHNGGWNINICDSRKKGKNNALGIVFSVCTKALDSDGVAHQLTQGLLRAGAKPLEAHA